MVGQKETARELVDECKNLIVASLSDNSEEIMLWSAEGGQSDMQATVWLNKDQAILLAYYLLELSFKIIE